MEIAEFTSFKKGQMKYQRPKKTVQKISGQKNVDIALYHENNGW